MIRFARRVRDVALLIRDLPEILGVELELAAEDQRAREDFDRRLTALEERVKRLGAITHELYIGPTEEVSHDA